MLACQPCTDYLLPVNGSSLRTPLTLTDSLPCCDLVLSSTTSFLSTSGKKRGKETPQGTNGSLTSLRGRRALGRVRFCHANWPLHLSGAKCGIDFPLTTSVAPADSRALFAPANRGAASKAPRFICRRQRFGAFRSAAYPCKRQGLLLLSRFPYRLSSFEPRDDRAVFFTQEKRAG